jgi:uracil-DNA glycosylase
MTKILLIGEALGQDEERQGVPFVGPSGVELLRMLGESGIIQLSSFDRTHLRRYWETRDASHSAAVWTLHPEIHRTNVFNIHPPANDLAFFTGPKASALPGYPALQASKWVRAEFASELDRLRDEILRHNPNVIICLGNSSLWALAGRTGITKYRGATLLSTHTVRDYKLLPTFHPAAVLRQWELRATAIADLIKAQRESADPELRRPHREIWIEPALDDIRRFITEHISGCRLLSVDIETSGSRITCIGFAPSSDRAIVVPFDDSRAKGGNYWPTKAAERECWDLVCGILGDPGIPKLFQNGLYDIAFLWRSMRIRVFGASQDTMLLSHALQPEGKKDLGYLGSIYTDEGAWKHMRKRDETYKREN